MKLSRKTFISTLAIGVAAASLTVTPLGNSLMPEILGVQTASAANNLDTVKNKLDKIYAELGPTDRQALRSLRDELQNITQAEFEEAFESILIKLPGAVSSETLYGLFKDAASLSYDPSYENLIKIRTNPEYIAAAKSIGEAGGIDNLTVDDMADFGLSVESQLVSLVGNKTLTQLLSLLEDSEARNQLIRDAYRNALSLPLGQGGGTFGQALTTLNITENDISTSVINVQNKLNPATVKAAVKALGLAYIAAEGINTKPEPPTTPVDPGTPGGGGAPGGGGGSVGGGGTPTAPTENPDTIPTTDTSVLDVSNWVTLTEGKATVNLDQTVVLNTIKALQSAGEDEQRTLTLDLKTVNAQSISISIPQAIVDEANKASISRIAVLVNGLTLALPIGQFGDSITLSIDKLDDASVTSITSARLASDVYEFGLEVAGSKVSAFRNPVEIRIPLRNTSADPELLTVVKIVNGNIQFEGGMVEGGTIVETRDSFSAYAVVENKVSFNDIDSVQVWAGRQIEVMAAKGIISGKGSGIFAPKDSVTRAEFAKMLIRSLNLENQFAKESFSDVNSGQWFTPYVAAASEKGIIMGRTAEIFAPQDSITRAEMATMITRALKEVRKLEDVNNNESVLNQFSDQSEIAASLRQGVAFAAANNLVIGSNGKFNPNGKASRAEAAVMIYRAMNFNIGK